MVSAAPDSSVSPSSQPPSPSTPRKATSTNKFTVKNRLAFENKDERAKFIDRAKRSTRTQISKLKAINLGVEKTKDSWKAMDRASQLAREKELLVEAAQIKIPSL
jgi:hypothetical protein